MASSIPGGVPDEAAEAAIQTLGGALAAGHQLTSASGDALIRCGARGVCAHAGYHRRAISAVMVMGTAVMAAIALRHAHPVPKVE